MYIPKIDMNVVREGEVNRFSAFASDIGLSPGEWPKEIIFKK
jgi:hypothetical protein